MPTPNPIWNDVPFNEALSALEKRYKNRVTTERWDEMLGEAHANAFTVAGATTEALVSDLGAAVKETISSGGTITDFRKQFDDIVARHGWSYKGNRGWRTKVIFETNARTAYATGHWDKIEQARKREEKRGRVLYLIYQIVGDGRVRPEHRAWEAIVRPVDDPFWQTHYPPNGWGCRCIVRTASERYLKARGIKPTPDSDLPDGRTEDRINTRTGEVYPDQIPGIDTGWNYNVGQSYMLGSAETFGTRIMRAAPEFRPAMLAQSDQFMKLLKPSYKAWARDVSDDAFDRGKIRPIGFMPNIVLDELENHPARSTPSTALISIKDSELRHATRPFKQSRGAAISADDIESLIGYIRKPSAILYDNKDEAIVYVFEGKDGLYKVVIAINDNDKGRVRNAVDTVGIVELHNLKEKHLDLIDGKL